MTRTPRLFTGFFARFASRMGMIAVLALPAALVLAPLGTATPASAQNLFETVITVNNSPITRYELDQREKLLAFLRAPGDAKRLARKQLIEDRLKLQAARDNGIIVSDELIAQSMERFAAQGKLKTPQFLQLLAKGGVSEETFRDFIRAGVAWSDLTRARFAPRISVSEEDLERARAAISQGSGVQVLLSEIIIPYTEQTQEQVETIARDITQARSIGAFATYARKYSATATAPRGGQLPWTPINKLPPALQGIVLGLAPGEVTDPLPLQGAVAMFQMRDIMETDVPSRSYAAIEYAAYYIDGGRSEAALARARQIEADTDTCDDLYGIAQGQPANVLERGSRAPGDLPNDIAIELSRLDPGEVSYTLTRANGQTLVLLMLCGRAETIEEEAPAQAGDGDNPPEPTQSQRLSQQIGEQRLGAFADGYLAQLRSEARIVEK